MLKIGFMIEKIYFFVLGFGLGLVSPSALFKYNTKEIIISRATIVFSPADLTKTPIFSITATTKVPDVWPKRKYRKIIRTRPRLKISTRNQRTLFKKINLSKIDLVHY